MTCLASNNLLGARFRATLVYLLAALLMSASSYAETGVVSATGVGKDTPEAIINLLKVTVGKYFKTDPQFTHAVLQTEILPNASSFVQSYKLNEGSHPGAVSLSANIDLDVIHGLLSLTPKNVGETAGAKALVIVKGAKLPDSVLSTLKSKTPPDPFAPLVEAAKERFFRREFSDAELAPEDLQQVSAGDDVASPEVLRGLGAKAGARVVLVVTGRYETFENENAHNKEERMVLSSTMLDVKTGAVIGRASVNVVNPKSRKEQYVQDLSRNVLEESKDLLQDVFVAAGRKLVKAETHDEFTVVRVAYPSNGALVARFKQLLEGVPGVRSVLEYSVKRGKFDFAVRPAVAEAALLKGVAAAAAQATDIAVAPLERVVAANEPEDHPPSVTFKLEPKEAAQPAAEGGPNAAPAAHR